MTPTCDHCKQTFALDAGQTARVENAKAKEHHAIIVKCPNCDMSTFVQWAEPKRRELPLRCPLSACSGHVTRLQHDGSESWACGECGSQWKQFSTLQNEITAIVKKFAYRKKCYRKKGGNWIGAPDSEVEDYEDRVANEPDDPAESYQRD